MYIIITLIVLLALKSAVFPRILQISYIKKVLYAITSFELSYNKLLL